MTSRRKKLLVYPGGLFVGVLDLVIDRLQLWAKLLVIFAGRQSQAGSLGRHDGAAIEQDRAQVLQLRMSVELAPLSISWFIDFISFHFTR